MPVTGPAPDGEVDVRVADGAVTGVTAALTPPSGPAGEEILDAGGRWLIPGLWDQHVHLGQWALPLSRLDLGPATSVEHAVRLVADHLAVTPDDGSVVQSWGHRSALWGRSPTVAELDAVAGGRPVVLMSGDGHHAWLSTTALDRLGLPRRDGVVTEREWFEAYPRLAALPGATARLRTDVRRAVHDASSHGVVGVVDLEFDQDLSEWPSRVADGVTGLRVREGVYPHGLDAAIAAGLRTGDPLPGGEGLVTMGPLKVIYDGSLNTRTAWCCEPFADARGLVHPRGVRNYSPADLTGLLRRATEAGLQVAVHAIGDAAATEALDAVEASGATGSLEHLQLLRREDLPRIALAGLRASVQPAHLLDDRDVTAVCWPDRQDRCFAFASLRAAGVDLVLGSDAPVAPLDPWLAMAAAVHRSGDEREPWHPEESLTPQQALAASTDGQGTVRVGSHADLALLDGDPLAPYASTREAADRLRRMPVAVTVLGGRVTWSHV